MYGSSGLFTTESEMVVSIIRGPQYEHQNILILIIGTSNGDPTFWEAPKSWKKVKKRSATIIAKTLCDVGLLYLPIA